eukprot:93749_1
MDAMEGNSSYWGESVRGSISERTPVTPVMPQIPIKHTVHLEPIMSNESHKPSVSESYLNARTKQSRKRQAIASKYRDKPPSSAGGSSDTNMTKYRTDFIIGSTRSRQCHHTKSITNGQ